MTAFVYLAVKSVMFPNPNNNGDWAKVEAGQFFMSRVPLDFRGLELYSTAELYPPAETCIAGLREMLVDLES